LTPAGVDDVTGMTELDAGGAASRADGTFTFLGIPPGRYVLTATKRGSADAMMQAFAGAFGAANPAQKSAPTPTLHARALVTVGAGDVTNVSLVLREGATVSGTIEFDGTSPRPPPDQLGGRGISIRLTRADGRAVPMMGSTQSTSIEPAGRFVMSGNAPGRYLVSVQGRLAGPGAVWAPASALHDGRDLLVDPFDVSDSDITGVVISFTDRPTRLSGSVTVGGAPARTATVVLVPADLQAWIKNGMPLARARQVITSRTGAYSMVDLRPGDYLLAAIDDEDARELQDVAFVQRLAPIARRVTLAAGENSQALQVVRVPR
jgi:uncharacterized protein (DUF2141 family)